MDNPAVLSLLVLAPILLVGGLLAGLRLLAQGTAPGSPDSVNYNVSSPIQRLRVGRRASVAWTSVSGAVGAFVRG